MTDAESQIRRYKQLRYTRAVELHEPEGGEAYYLAKIEELPGVEASGGTRHEALYHLTEAFESYLQAMIELGHAKKIPEPQPWPDAYPGERPASRGGHESVTEPESTGDQEDWRPEGWDPEVAEAEEGPELVSV